MIHYFILSRLIFWFLVLPPYSSSCIFFYISFYYLLLIFLILYWLYRLPRSLILFDIYTFIFLESVVFCSITSIMVLLSKSMHFTTLWFLLELPLSTLFFIFLYPHFLCKYLFIFGLRTPQYNLNSTTMMNTSGIKFYRICWHLIGFHLLFLILPSLELIFLYWFKIPILLYNSI